MVYDPDRIPEQALDWIDAGKGAALATVVETWGSAPRPVGAQLAISSAAELAGSVSGGCVEGAVTAEALEAIADGRSRLLAFGVSDDDAFAVGLPCGGDIRILVEPLGTGDGPPLDLIRELAARRAAREPVALSVDLESWARGLATDAAAADAETRAALISGRSGFSRTRPSLFIAVHAPPRRLAVIGAAHIAQALVPMARIAGFDVTVIDPRAAFATPERFPDLPAERIVVEYPGPALAAHGLDRGVAVACLTHDPKIDDEALIPALRSSAFYVGALGSTRTQAKRAARLTEGAGLSPDALARLSAPIGLDIGAQSPAEIAAAVLAEMIEAWRRPARAATSVSTSAAADAPAPL